MSDRAALYADGYSIREIARMEGITHQAVRFWLMRRGIHEAEPRPRRDLSRAVDWYCRGVDVSAICRRFGICQTTLYSALNQTGTPLRYPRISAARRKEHTDNGR